MARKMVLKTCAEVARNWERSRVAGTILGLERELMRELRVYTERFPSGPYGEVLEQIDRKHIENLRRMVRETKRLRRTRQNLMGRVCFCGAGGVGNSEGETTGGGSE